MAAIPTHASPPAVTVVMLLLLGGTTTAFIGTYGLPPPNRPRCCHDSVPPHDYGTTGPKRWQAPLRQAAYHSLARRRAFSGSSLDQRLESDSVLWERIEAARFMRRMPEADNIELRTGVLVRQGGGRDDSILEFRTTDQAIYNCPGRWCRPADGSLIALWRVRQTKDNGHYGLWIRIKLLDGPGKPTEEDVYQYSLSTGLRQIQPQPTLDLKLNGAKYVWKTHLSSRIIKPYTSDAEERSNLDERTDVAVVPLTDEGLRDYHIFGLRSALENKQNHYTTPKKHRSEIKKLDDKGIFVSTGPDGYNHVTHRVTKIRKNLHQNAEFEPRKPFSGFLPSYTPQKIMLHTTSRPSVYNYGSAKKQMEYKPGFITIYREDKASQVKPIQKLELQYFKPSTPFMRFSERDPFYHSEEELQPTPPLMSDFRNDSLPHFNHDTGKYPDSINAQLPPVGKDTDTRVPYVSGEVINPALILHIDKVMKSYKPSPHAEVTDLPLINQSVKHIHTQMFNTSSKANNLIQTHPIKYPKISYIAKLVTDPSLVRQPSKGVDSTEHNVLPYVTDSAFSVWTDSDFGRKMGSIAIIETAPPNLTAGVNQILNRETLHITAALSNNDISTKTTPLTASATLTTTKSWQHMVTTAQNTTTANTELAMSTVPRKQINDKVTSGVVQDGNLLSKDTASTTPMLPISLWTVESETKYTTTDSQQNYQTQKEETVHTVSPDYPSIWSYDTDVITDSTSTVEDNTKNDEIESTTDSGKTTNGDTLPETTNSEDRTEPTLDTTTFPGSILDDIVTESTQWYPSTLSDVTQLKNHTDSSDTGNITLTPEEVVIALTNQAFQKSTIVPSQKSTAANSRRSKGANNLISGTTGILFDKHMRRVRHLDHSLIINRVSQSVSYKTSRGETGELSTNQILHDTPLDLSQRLNEDLIDLTMAE